MRKNIIYGIIIFASILISGFTTIIFAVEIKKGDKVKITTNGTKARLCPQPMCGEDQQILRIPEGTTLLIEGIKDMQSGSMSVKWFEVKYKKNKGWISIYDTDKQ